jgi:acylglycerol lipase
MRRLRLALLLLGGLAACAPRLQPPGDQISTPAIAPNESTWQAGDGRILPLRRWLPGQELNGQQPKAVVLAMHGFNDYSNAFTEAAEWWAGQGIATYASDQRGFGRAPFTGYWSGEDRMADDLAELHALLRRQHPGAPVYWLGESMGGAVVLHGRCGIRTCGRPARCWWRRPDGGAAACRCCTARRSSSPATPFHGRPSPAAD